MEFAVLSILAAEAGFDFTVYGVAGTTVAILLFFIAKLWAEVAAERARREVVEDRERALLKSGLDILPEVARALVEVRDAMGRTVEQAAQIETRHDTDRLGRIVDVLESRLRDLGERGGTQ